MLAYRLFLSIQNQWIYGGMGSPMALNYEVAYRWMDAEGIDKAKQNDLLAELQLIESGAISAMREKQERRGK
ncbi:DUF1799 domain-containing protein [Comamonas serinivorans]|uniref:DUF1799 domain-containing protein n=1 Tax=Comamonas serinivorans TaxID=1082851 RepID=UPI001F37DACD|nr:DUF1799 domain-containing protein [Comamonas serinivorans]